MNNLPAGHAFESATLINLDRRGEQQGVVVLARYRNEEIVYKTLIYMHNGHIVRNVSQHGMTGFFLSLYNMLYYSEANPTYFIRNLVELDNGILQVHTLFAEFWGDYWRLPYSDNRILQEVESALGYEFRSCHEKATVNAS